VSRLLRAGAAAALALSLASCAGKAPDTAAAEPSPTSTAGSSLTSSAGTTVDVSYANGQTTGGGRIPVTLNSPVTIRVTSDVADEVHVHGYDLMTDVHPGTPATVTFDATVPGVFEVELEDLGQQLLTLQVQ
jgi:heme/copper-type cytochrome/quinol oxidase subunit 2